MISSSNNYSIPPFVKDELHKDERVEWFGQPDKMWIFKVSSPLMLLALAIAFGMRHHVSLEYHGLFSLFSWVVDIAKFLPIAALGAAPLLFCRRAARTYYVITNQRVILAIDGRRRTYETYDRSTLTPSLRMEILGRTLVRWDAPGFHQDSDGDATRNGVTFGALDSSEPSKMGVDFPGIPSAVERSRGQR